MICLYSWDFDWSSIRFRRPRRRHTFQSAFRPAPVAAKVQYLVLFTRCTSIRRHRSSRQYSNAVEKKILTWDIYLLLCFLFLNSYVKYAICLLNRSILISNLCVKKCVPSVRTSLSLLLRAPAAFSLLPRC